MADQVRCCLLEICCAPKSAGAINALADALAAETGMGSSAGATPQSVASWILGNFDLAPAGTLQPFKDAIVGMIVQPAKLSVMRARGGGGLGDED